METNPQADRQQIEQLLLTLQAAWKAGSGAGYAACFTNDCDYVTFDGNHIRGREANARLHQELFEGVLRGSELIGGELTGFRLLAPTVALLHSTGAVKLRWQRHAPSARQSVQTLVAVREAGAWKLAAFQNTRISPPGLLARLLRLVK